jgi:CheY-like chemotaxis protein
MTRVLCVDDHEEVVQLLKLSLELEGYDVETSLSAEEGLKKLKKQPFDLIITDLEMPGMNGWEFCEKLKGDPRYKSIPIIALTIVSEGLSEKPVADSHLVKPASVGMICDEIERLVSKGKRKDLKIH